MEFSSLTKNERLILANSLIEGAVNHIANERDAWEDELGMPLIIQDSIRLELRYEIYEGDEGAEDDSQFVFELIFDSPKGGPTAIYAGWGKSWEEAAANFAADVKKFDLRREVWK